MFCHYITVWPGVGGSRSLMPMAHSTASDAWGRSGDGAFGGAVVEVNIDDAD